MKICELIVILQQYDPLAEIRATWEGQDLPFDIYLAADGRIMIDADNNHYKLRWQDIKCEVCGKNATGMPDNKPVCYAHWGAFKEEK